MPDGIKKEIYRHLCDYLEEEIDDRPDDSNELEPAAFLHALFQMLQYQRGEEQPDALQNDSAREIFNRVIPKLTGDESFCIAPDFPYGSEEIDKAFEKVYGYAKEKHERREEKKWEHNMRFGDYGYIASQYAYLVEREIIKRGGDPQGAKFDSYAIENAVGTLVDNLQNGNLKRLAVSDANYEAYLKISQVFYTNNLGLEMDHENCPFKAGEILDLLKEIRDLPKKRLAAEKAKAKAEAEAKAKAEAEAKAKAEAEAKAKAEAEAKAKAEAEAKAKAAPPEMTPDIRARYIRTTLTGLAAFNKPDMDPEQMERLANTFANLADYAMEQPGARADFVDKGLETLFKQYPEQAETLKTICTAEDLNLSRNERVREVLRLCYMTEMNDLSPRNFAKLNDFNPFTAKQVPGVSKPAHKQEEKQAQKQAQANPMSL